MTSLWKGLVEPYDAEKLPMRAGDKEQLKAPQHAHTRLSSLEVLASICIGMRASP